MKSNIPLNNFENLLTDIFIQMLQNNKNFTEDLLNTIIHKYDYKGNVCKHFLQYILIFIHKANIPKNL